MRIAFCGMVGVFGLCVSCRVREPETLDTFNQSTATSSEPNALAPNSPNGSASLPGGVYATTVDSELCQSPGVSRAPEVTVPAGTQFLVVAVVAGRKGEPWLQVYGQPPAYIAASEAELVTANPSGRERLGAMSSFMTVFQGAWGQRKLQRAPASAGTLPQPGIYLPRQVSYLRAQPSSIAPVIQPVLERTALDVETATVAEDGQVWLGVSVGQGVTGYIPNDECAVFVNHRPTAADQEKAAASLAEARAAIARYGVPARGDQIPVVLAGAGPSPAPTKSALPGSNTSNRKGQLGPAPQVPRWQFVGAVEQPAAARVLVEKSTLSRTKQVVSYWRRFDEAQPEELPTDRGSVLVKTIDTWVSLDCVTREYARLGARYYGPDGAVLIEQVLPSAITSKLTAQDDGVAPDAGFVCLYDRATERDLEATAAREDTQFEKIYKSTGMTGLRSEVERCYANGRTRKAHEQCAALDMEASIADEAVSGVGGFPRDGFFSWQQVASRAYQGYTRLGYTPAQANYSGLLLADVVQKVFQRKR